MFFKTPVLPALFDMHQQKMCVNKCNERTLKGINTSFTHDNIFPVYEQLFARIPQRDKRRRKCFINKTKMWQQLRLKPKSDIHCNRSATSPRPKFITIAEVAEESQLGFAVGRRLVGDWSATDRGLVADWSATGRRPRGDLFATWCN